MEFVPAKKTRSRKRKRSVKHKRRVQRKLEVKAATARKVISETINAMKNEPQSRPMDAHSFWENYTVAQKWQQRHSVAWWKSRCRALEYENQVLRQKIRSEAAKQTVPDNSYNPETDTIDYVADAESEQDSDDDENLEFQVDKEMLDFLEQSVRHKMELKRNRESEIEASSESDPSFVTAEARERAKTEDARLLYGDASPGIMAMEAALQATVDRHKDRAKPNYWPNIPLKP